MHQDSMYPESGFEKVQRITVPECKLCGDICKDPEDNIWSLRALCAIGKNEQQPQGGRVGPQNNLPYVGRTRDSVQGCGAKRSPSPRDPRDWRWWQGTRRESHLFRNLDIDGERRPRRR